MANLAESERLKWENLDCIIDNGVYAIGELYREQTDLDLNSGQLDRLYTVIEDFFLKERL